VRIVVEASAHGLESRCFVPGGRQAMYNLVVSLAVFLPLAASAALSCLE
jgi:hypothetical protein